MRPAGFETAITASERSQTHVLDREPTGSTYSDFLDLIIFGVLVDRKSLRPADMQCQSLLQSQTANYLQ